MPRYGDFDKLEKELNERLRDLREEYGDYDAYTDGFEEAVTRIENAPTADVVEVVRCKDCKYWKEIGFDPILERKDGFCRNPQLGESETTGDDFCSDGERRNDED